MLEEHKYTPKAHASVRTLFNKQFVRSGVFPKGPLPLCNELFYYRHKSDYDVFFEFFEPELAQLLKWIPETEAFIDAIVDRIESR